ncbi:hypothetical protein [Flavivirga algicola]|uniref:Uncharacterized protein n=1 Tax=Flavivirga algicola TaxID=2729136 RepID=A0ABX1RYB4_9FLAO|nr:hypothetical protein [Flavivirga algicola]NMH87995.1 hypothetical protein [Flavivirga algicola]
MKYLKIVFAFTLLCTNWCQSQDQQENDFTLLDNIAVNNVVYGVNLKSSSTQFTLQICDNTNCYTTRDYVIDIAPKLLVNDVLQVIKTNMDSALVIASVSQTDKDQIAELKTKIQAAETKKAEAQRTEVENLLKTIDEEKDQYSAELLLNSSTKIPYTVITYELKKEHKEDLESQRIKDIRNSLSETDGAVFNNVISTKNFSYLSNLAKKDYTTFSSDTEVKKFNDAKKLYNNLSLKQEQNRIDQYKCKHYNEIRKKGQGSLKIKNALVQFFNNKASSIYIEAEINDGGVTETLIFVNSDFSVPLRYFNNYNSSVTAFSKVVSNNGYRKEISVDYNDIFDYKADQFFNYSVANSQVHLSNEEDSKYGASAKVVQRRFLDFFTGVIYSDVMGFNTDNSNSLLNAQAKLLLPLNLRNIKKWSFGRQFITTANIALDNSFQNENRFIDIKDDEAFSNFDLLKKNNLYGKFALDVISHEAKGWFTYISLGYNAAFYRTGLRYTETQPNVEDTVTERQLLSVSHGPFLNFEIRPQSNFGADVTFSIEDLNYSDIPSISSRNFKGDIIQDVGKDHFIMPFNLINIEANFYWLVNPEKSKGGIYAKLGSYFNTDTNGVFPQIMVGYATNLTSFVNRFKPKKPETAKE